MNICQALEGAAAGQWALLGLVGLACISIGALISSLGRALHHNKDENHHGLHS